MSLQDPSPLSHATKVPGDVVGAGVAAGVGSGSGSGSGSGCAVGCDSGAGVAGDGGVDPVAILKSAQLRNASGYES
jgi:hypothetical protein